MKKNINRTATNINFNENGFYSKDLTDDEFYQNILHLLERYRIVKWAINHELMDMNEVCLELTDQALDDYHFISLEFDPRVNTKIMESRLKCIKNCKVILDLINRSLMILKEKPVIGYDYYTIIYNYYISNEEITIEKLAEELETSRSTIFRNKKDALNEIGIILWGFFYIAR